MTKKDDITFCVDTYKHMSGRASATGSRDIVERAFEEGFIDAATYRAYFEVMNSDDGAADMGRELSKTLAELSLKNMIKYIRESYKLERLERRKRREDAKG